MSTNRLFALSLIVPLLSLGLLMGTPRPAKASDDLGWLLGGAVLGALLFSDQPHHYSYYEPPTAQVYYYPSTRVYVWPERPEGRYYPYGHRYWVFAGYNWRGRPVFVPVSQAPRLQGTREYVRLGAGHYVRPVFRVNIG
jgi:hypothetical protein